jgi:hypothetical protein
MRKNGSVTPKASDEHAEFKKNIVAHGLMRASPGLHHVFKLRDGDREV